MGQCQSKAKVPWLDLFSIVYKYCSLMCIKLKGQQG